MKKIISILVSIVLIFTAVPMKVSADSDNAYELYEAAMRKTMAGGNWREEMTMNADMFLSGNGQKIKTKASLDASLDILNYEENDLSDLQMSGNGKMQIMGQDYTWDIQYEKGIAHYQYIEPEEKSFDMKMDPNNFKFEELTFSGISDVKVWDNKIRFTIPGKQMESVGSTISMQIPGMSDIKYEDSNVEVELNKETGIIDKINMTYHAAMNYRGYSADTDYVVEYRFSKNGMEGAEENADTGAAGQGIMLEDGIVIYSDYPNLSVREESIITLLAGIIENGNWSEEVDGIEIEIENPDILTINKTGIDGGGEEGVRKYIQLRGIKAGVSKVTFKELDKGYIATALVTVYKDNLMAYSLSSVPAKQVGKYISNVYNYNGIYIDSYKYEMNENGTAKVTFDVYNTNYIYGAVSVYDEDGNIQEAVLIEKRTMNNTDIKEAVWDNIFCIIRDFIDFDFGTYRQETGWSKHTPVSVEIPRNGYIKISNDPINDTLVCVINAADIIFGVGKLTGKIADFDVESKEFSESLSVNLLKEEVYKTLLKDGNDEITEKLLENVGKEAGTSIKIFGSFIETIVQNMAELNFGKVISETALDFGISIAEKTFENLTGMIGKTLEGLFLFGEGAGYLLQYQNFINSIGVRNIYIQNQGGGILGSQEIKVKSAEGFDKDVALNVFQVRMDDRELKALKESNPDLYDKISKGKTYNISLIKNGEQMQPDEAVIVSLPIPEEMKVFARLGLVNVYRVEEDGRLTKMNADIKEDEFIFETNHFSLYSIVRENVKIEENEKIFLIVGAVVIFAILIKKKKRQIE